MIEELSALLLGPMQYTFMRRALIASIIVGINCGVLGSILILKRLALMGDAIAHAVLPGVAIAYLIGVNFFWGAVVTGIITALAIGFVTEHSKIKEDSAIGIMFSAAFALGILIMSRIQSGVDLFHILFGNVLGVSATDLKLIFILAALVVLLIILFFKEIKISSFDQVLARSIGLPTGLIHYLLMLMLSLTVVASLQTVGIVLVVAMLITPGATAYLLVERFSTMIILAGFFGLISSVMGLYLSFYLNVASGAAIVVVATFFFLLAFFFSPKEGLITTKKLF